MKQLTIENSVIIFFMITLASLIIRALKKALAVKMPL